MRDWRESDRELKIVFAHFGKRAPKHLILNIERCLTLFPYNPIILITNPACILPKMGGIEIHCYTPGEKWQQLDQNLSHPKNFRENFWLTSLARFLALEDYLARFTGEIIHVESDVILAKDFPFSKFSNLAKPLAFPVISKTQGIASVLYIRDHQSARSLVTLTMEMASRDSQTTDMLILRKFYELHPEITQLLPIGPVGSNSYQEFTDEKFLAEMNSAVSIFGGCFDGLDIGYFIYGVDPRNDKGKKHLRKSLPDNFLMIPKTQISFSKARNFLDIGSLGNECLIPLYSLHIHSKNPSLIRNSEPAKSLRRGASEYLSPQTYKFIPKIFIQATGNAIARRIKRINTLGKGY